MPFDLIFIPKYRQAVLLQLFSSQLVQASDPAWDSTVASHASQLFPSAIVSVAPSVAEAVILSSSAPLCFVTGLPFAPLTLNAAGLFTWPDTFWTQSTIGLIDFI